MLSDRVKWWLRSRLMVTAGEKDLSSLPTAATRAWAMLDIVRIIGPPRGWTFDMAWGGRGVVKLRGSSSSSNQVVGISQIMLASIANQSSLADAQFVIALFSDR
jgi:hypothetical protein